VSFCIHQEQSRIARLPFVMFPRREISDILGYLLPPPPPRRAYTTLTQHSYNFSHSLRNSKCGKSKRTMFKFVYNMEIHSLVKISLNVFISVQVGKFFDGCVYYMTQGILNACRSQTSYNIDCALGPLYYIRACSI
jgi:hypothetical protein